MSNVQVSVFTDLLEKALGGVETLFISKGKTSGSVLHASTNGSVAVVRVPLLEIEHLKEHSVEIDIKAFTGAVKGRDVSLSFTGHNIAIKSGKTYQASIAAAENSSVPGIMPQEENTTKIRLKDEHKQFVTKGLTLTKIEKTYSGITDTLVYIEATEKSIIMSTFEARQIAYIVVKNAIAFPVCSIVLPTGIMQKIQVLQGEVTLEVSESTCLFKSKSADLQIPLPIDTVNAIKRELVMEIIKTSRAKAKEADTNLSMKTSDVTSFLDNAQAITQVGSEVVIRKGKGNIVTLSVTTPKGKVEERFEGSVKRPFALDFTFIRAALVRSKAEVEIKLDDSFAIVATPEVTYIAALSEMAESSSADKDAS